LAQLLQSLLPQFWDLPLIFLGTVSKTAAQVALQFGNQQHQ